MSSVHSPPRSQEEEDLPMPDANFTSNPTFPDNETLSSKKQTANALPLSDMNGVNGKDVSDSNHGEPGSAWSTKKFAEEYERAFSQLQDQQWSMAQYGDPLLKK